MLASTVIFWASLIALVVLLILNLLKGTKEWFRGNEGSNGVIIQEPVQEFLNVSDVQQLPVKSFEPERSPVQDFLNVSDVQQQPVKPSEVLKPENPERTNSIGIRKMDIRTLPNTDY